MEERERDEILWRLDERTKKVDDHLERLDRRVAEMEDTVLEHEERVDTVEDDVDTAKKVAGGVGAAVTTGIGGFIAEVAGLIKF